MSNLTNNAVTIDATGQTNSVYINGKSYISDDLKVGDTDYMLWDRSASRLHLVGTNPETDMLRIESTDSDAGTAPDIDFYRKNKR